MTSLSLPFFNFNVGSIRTAHYPGSILASVSVRFRSKERGRECGVQIMGTVACFKKRTRGKREEIFSRFIFSGKFFARALRLLALYYPGSYRCPQQEVNWQEAPLLSFVCFACLYFLFCFLYIYIFSACYCHCFAFRCVLFQCKEIVPLPAVYW